MATGVNCVSGRTSTLNGCEKRDTNFDAPTVREKGIRTGWGDLKL